MPRESALKDAILKVIRDAGGWATKTHGEAMQERGLPDIIACIAGVFVGLEVKRPGEEVTPMQEYQLQEIRNAGGYGAVVNDSDRVREAIRFWPYVCRVCLRPSGSEVRLLCPTHQQ